MIAEPFLKGRDEPMPPFRAETNVLLSHLPVYAATTAAPPHFCRTVPPAIHRPSRYKRSSPPIISPSYGDTTQRHKQICARREQQIGGFHFATFARTAAASSRQKAITSLSLRAMAPISPTAVRLISKGENQWWANNNLEQLTRLLIRTRSETLVPKTATITNVY